MTELKEELKVKSDCSNVFVSRDTHSQLCEAIAKYTQEYVDSEFDDKHIQGNIKFVTTQYLALARHNKEKETNNERE